jgi:hypothetical protein
MTSFSEIRSAKWFMPSMIGLAVLLVIGVVSAVFLWGLYYQQWDNAVVTRLTGIVPIPAARLGTQTVTYRQYLDGVHSMQKYRTTSEAKAIGDDKPITVQDRKSVLESLLSEAALDEAAATRKVIVTNEQEQSAMSSLFASGSSTQEITDFIFRINGWTIQDFKKHFVRPMILANTLKASFATDHGGDQNALNTYMEERLLKPDVIRYVKF